MEEKCCGPGIGVEMMKKMMEGQDGSKFPMMERCMQMCEQTNGTVIDIGKMASYATPELRGLFEEWVKVVEDEILAFVKEQGSAYPPDIAAKLKLSEESVLFLVGKMAREGKLKITGVKP